VAGKDDISKKDDSKKDEVVLWSEFSQVTNTIAIPGKSYFFPSGLKEVSKAATIRVSKYMMGRWYSKDFVVQPGETIGSVAKVYLAGVTGDSNAAPVNIDFSTGAIMVDAIAANNWPINRYMTPKLYYDVIYSTDNVTLRKIACDMSFWPKDVSDRYSEIDKLQNEPILPLKPWEPQSSRRIGPVKPDDTGGVRLGTKEGDSMGRGR